MAIFWSSFCCLVLGYLLNIKSVSPVSVINCILVWTSLDLIKALELAFVLFIFVWSAIFSIKAFLEFLFGGGFSIYFLFFLILKLSMMLGILELFLILSLYSLLICLSLSISLFLMINNGCAYLSCPFVINRIVLHKSCNSFPAVGDLRKLNQHRDNVI